MKAFIAHRARSTFLIPSVLAVMAATGLTAALIGDGSLDVLSWVCLALPIGIVAWALWGHRAKWPRTHGRAHRV